MSELIEYIEDSCPDCKKQIFATHDRFYVTFGNGVPSDYIGYDFDINDFAPATYSTLELHRLYFTSTGNCYDFPTGVQGCPSTSTGILFSDPTFQAKLDDILVQEGYVAGDIIITTNGSLWTAWFSPSFDYTNNTNLFWAGDNTDYFNKITPTIVTNESPSLEDVCLPIQEIKEKDSCTGEETYRYVTEDGNGILVDASVFIPNFDEDNIVFNCPEDPKVEYIPHVSGCIRRKTGTITATCSSTTTTYDFSDTDMVGFTITANDGNGNYTIIQEQANTIAHDKFLALLQNVSQTNARTVEDIGPGFIMFNFWSGNVSNVIDYSPTEVQFEIHVEAGVSDTPVALTVPCVDPIPDSTYQSSATALRSIYDPVPLNTQQANSGTALIFTVTNYTVSYEVIGGSDIIIPAKQILYKDIDRTIIEEFRSVGNISSLIIFNPITDTFSINCEKDPLPNVQEKEVCGTIDGSTDSYELIKVYTRDILTGISTILHYEDNFGNIITGTVAEVCCTCDTLCEIAAPIPLRNIRCQGYAANLDPNLSQSPWMLGYSRYDQSYWNSVCGVGTVTGFTWELDSLIHNGTEYISTPIIITVPFSSMTFTPTGVPTEFATFFNTTLNTYGINLDPDMATKEYVNGATWLLAFRQYPNPVACSGGPINRLEVLTEYGDGFEFTSMLNPTLNDIQSYTMNLYNVGQGGTSLNGNNGCVTI
jgi:hypothetical protein